MTGNGDRYTVLGLSVTGGVPEDAIPVAVLVIAEAMHTDGAKALYVLSSDMTSWAAAGFLIAALDQARDDIGEGWETDT